MGGLFGGGGGQHIIDDQVAGVSLQTSCYGGPIPILWGTQRLPANLLDYDDWTAIPHTTSQDVGKGGGGTTITQTSWSYTAGVIMGLCEGPVDSINHVWSDKAVGDMARYGWGLQAGHRTQDPWSTWAGRHGWKACAYAGIAYVFHPAIDLGGSGTLKNNSFEVRGLLATVSDGAQVVSASLGTGDGVCNYFLVRDPYGTVLTSPEQAVGVPQVDGTTPSGWRLACGRPYVYTVSHSRRGESWNEAVTRVEDPGCLYVVFQNPPPKGAAVTWLRASWTPMDAWPADVIPDFLSNPHYGALWDPARIDDLKSGPASFHTYCVAMGFALSPWIKDQKPAAEHLQELLDATNSEAVWSAGPGGMRLRIVPYGDQPVSGNGATYQPDTRQCYDVQYSDFLGVVDAEGNPTGADAVTVEITSPADVYNTVPVDFNDRANSYNTNTLDDPEPVDVIQNGPKKASSLALPCITRGYHAQLISRIRGQRNVYVRRKFTCHLGWKYLLLEPMDLITLSEPGLQLDLQMVRLVSVDIPGEDDEASGMTVISEEWPIGTAHALPGTVPDPSVSHIPNTAASAGDTYAPVIVSLPPALSRSGKPELAIGASGGRIWGGCEVWMSTDGSAYSRVGLIRRTATHGYLTAAASEADPSFAVDVSACGRQLASVTTDQARALQTATYCDCEVFAWTGATLTGEGQYTLDGLLRGQGGTRALSHVQYSPFLVLDDAVLVLPLAPEQFDRKLWFKFPSFNTWGRSAQSLADLQPTLHYPSNLLGAQEVSGLAVVYIDKRQRLVWDRIPLEGVLYEVRRGAAWASAGVIGTVTDPSCAIPGNGVYWVAGVFNGVYSRPVSIDVLGGVIVDNVVVTWDESGEGWQGTRGGACIVNADGQLTLDGTTPWDSLEGNVDDLQGVVDELSGVAAEGEYVSPHEVDLGLEQLCQVSSEYGFTTESPATASARLWIQTAGNDGAYGDWTPFAPGPFIRRKFRMKVVLSNTDPAGHAPVLGPWRWTVDMPDRTETRTHIQTPASGSFDWPFSRPFQVVGGRPNPNVQVTLLDPGPNDVLVVDAQDQTHFQFHITDGSGGAVLSRLVNLFAQGF